MAYYKPEQEKQLFTALKKINANLCKQNEDEYKH